MKPTIVEPAAERTEEDEDERERFPDTDSAKGPARPNLNSTGTLMNVSTIVHPTTHERSAQS